MPIYDVWIQLFRMNSIFLKFFKLCCFIYLFRLFAGTGRKHNSQRYQKNQKYPFHGSSFPISIVPRPIISLYIILAIYNRCGI